MQDPNQFNGDGMESGPFTEQERRQLRHAVRVLDANFRKMDAHQLKAVALIGNLQRLWPLFPVIFALGAASKWEGLLSAIF